MEKPNSFFENVYKDLKVPELAAEYISFALKENNASFLATVLGDVVKAHGMSHISEVTGLARQALYKMLSKDGNPTLQSMNALLDAVGLELSVSLKKKRAS